MKRKFALGWILLLGMVTALPLAAQEASEWTVEDILLAESADGFTLSLTSTMCPFLLLLPST